MKKFRFTPEMFPGWHPKHIQAIADQANAALDEHLNGLVRVCSQKIPGERGVPWYGVSYPADTHTALLFDVEELKPKECEHVALKLCRDGRMNCNDCGKVLEYRLVEVL